jgi:hypothetical protein
MTTRTLFRFFAPLAATAIALAASACTPAVRLTAPNGFAEIDKSDPYAYRAATAQGVVVAVRSEKNELHANVDFWADAIDLRLRKQGYTAESAKLVKSASGMEGKQIRYSREEDQRTYRYWLTVFANSDRVYVVEAAGDKEAFDPAVKSVEETVLSLKGG